MSASHAVLLQVDPVELLVGSQPHPEPARVSPAAAPAVDVGDHAAERISGVELHADRLDFMATGSTARLPVRVGVDEALRVWRKEGVVPGHPLQHWAVLEQPQEAVRGAGPAVAIDYAAAVENLTDRKPGGAAVVGWVGARIAVDDGGVRVELDGELFRGRCVAGRRQDSAADGVVERLGAQCAGAGVAGAGAELPLIEHG